MSKKLRVSRSCLALTCALLAGACNGKTGGTVHHHASGLAPTVSLDLPSGPVATEAPLLHVRGRASGPQAFTSVLVNGVAATSSDGFAHWELDVPLISGDQTLTVDATDSGGNHANAHADVERVPRMLARFDIQDLTLDFVSQRLFFCEGSSESVVGVPITAVGPAFVSNALDGSGATLEFPFATAFDAAHARVLVWDVSFSGNQHLTAIDPTTGDRSIVSSPTQGAGPMPASTASLAIDAAGANLYLYDFFNGAFYVVDLATGDRTIFSDATHGSGPFPFVGAECCIALDEAGGRLIVTDNFDLELLTVDLATGDRAILSDNAGTGSGPALTNPFDVAVAPGRNSVFVADESQVLEVDLATGNRTIFSGASVGSGPSIAFAQRIDVSESLGIVVVFAGTDSSLLSIALATGDRTELTSEPVVGTGADIEDAQDLAIDTTRDRVIEIGNDSSSVIAIDRATGDRSILSSSSSPAVGSGPSFAGELQSLVVDAAADAVFIVDDEGFVYRVALGNGDRSILSDDSHGSGNPIDRPAGIALDAARGRLLVLDTGNQALVAVSLATGDRTIVSENDTVGAGPDFGDPEDLDLDLAHGRALISDSDVEGVFAVDLLTGDRSLLSGTGHGVGPAFVNVGAIAVDAAGGRAIVADHEDPARLVAIDLATGDRSVLSDDSGANGFGPTLLRVNGLCFDALHNLLLVPDDERKSCLAVDAATGDRIEIAH